MLTHHRPATTVDEHVQAAARPAALRPHHVITNLIQHSSSSRIKLVAVQYVVQIPARQTITEHDAETITCRR